MINALPLLFGLLESSIPGNDPTGGVHPDSPNTSGNFSGHPFDNILRDQSVGPSLLRGFQRTLSSGDQLRLPGRESLEGSQPLSFRALENQGRLVDLLRMSDSDRVALPLSDDGLSLPYQGSYVETARQKFQDQDGLIPTPRIPFMPLEKYGMNDVGEGAGLTAQPGISPGQFSHVGAPSYANLAPDVSLAGGPGGGRISMVTNADPPQVFPEAIKGTHVSVGSSNGEPTIRQGVEPERNIEYLPERVSRAVQDADRSVLRMSPPLTGVVQASPRPSANQAFQAPLPFQEVPQGVADGGQSAQGRWQSLNGVSSFLRETPGNGKENFVVTRPDLLGDSSLPGSGDRSKDVLEEAGKIAGVDSNGGQGLLNNGMGGSPHSQQGFQQSLPSPLFGPSARMPEDRVPELPTPALQRLQMEVQVSETSRIQIDVGVQHRQVYAGLLMDQATLKNLAVQFAPQLHDQLAQIDMDLQEFSAEIRQQREDQKSDMGSHGWEPSHGQRKAMTVSTAPESFPHSVKGVEGQRLHLVA